MIQLSFLLTLLGIVGAELDCRLECFNNSTCALSTADFSDHPVGADGKPLDIHVETSRDGKHCACPPGFTGLRCARSYISCYPSSDTNHKCYHGGRCIPGLMDIYGNNQYYCDCSDAKDADGVEYVGKYCETAAIQKCDPDGKSFCVNGKPCKADFEKTPLEPCECGGDYVGAHCEFEKSQVPDCNMTCYNGGKCRLGLKNLQLARWGYEDYFKVPDTAQYCECPEGFLGVHCNIPAEVCGDRHCFNGGKCLGVNDEGGPICDCTSAHNPSHSYAGTYCQYESTTFCEQGPDEDGQTFCVNGGTCNKEGNHLECDCPDNFGGPVCEYNTAIESVPTCSLQCMNGGICRKGVKDFGTLKTYGPALTKILDNNTTENLEHCICPDGYTGLTCNIKVDTCSSGDHVCLHGAECVSVEGEDKCKCASAYTMFSRFAGKHCEHPSTQICTANGEPEVEVDRAAFCVNNGKCIGNADGNGHPGCDCPAEFTGPHCEFSTSAVGEAVYESSDGGGRGKIGIVIFAVLFSAVVVVITGAIMYSRRNTRREDDLDLKPAKTASSEDSSNQPPVLDMGPEKDFDGNELENIEII